MEQSFIAYIENSIKENWDLDALTDYKGATPAIQGCSPQNRKTAYHF